MLAAAAMLGALGSVRGAMMVDLQPHGDHSIRVRIAPSGSAIVDPPAMALLFTPPQHSTPVSSGGANSLTNGNLKVDVDPATGFVTATRLTDKKVLLEQTARKCSSSLRRLLPKPPTADAAVQ